MSTSYERMNRPIRSRHDLVDEAQSRLDDVRVKSQNLVRENPFSSALVTAGVGFALGLAAAALLIPPRRHTWSEDHLPNWMSWDRMRNAASGLMPSSCSRSM